MREVFVKKNENGLLHIEINMSAGEFKEANPYLFSVFVKYEGMDASASGYEEFLETKESLIIAIEYEDKAHYLGSRVVDGWYEFYFCASSAKELNSMVPALFKDTGYVYESNIIKDKKWDFYELQLFPSELEQIHIQSEKIIFLLEEEEEDLSIQREVEHYISFLTPTHKNRFLNTLDVEGFTFKDELDPDEFTHGIALVKKQAVSREIVEDTINELYKKIKEEQGFYEGWSTTLMSESIE